MERFKGKIKATGKVYHVWKPTEINGVFIPICNPGMDRARSEIHEVTGNERLCEVCKLHGAESQLRTAGIATSEEAILAEIDRLTGIINTLPVKLGFRLSRKIAELKMELAKFTV